MRVIGADQAAQHLIAMLDEVERGQSVTIVRNGRSVAGLVPVRSHEDVSAAAEALREFRRERSLAGARRRDLIDEGRRSP